MDHYLRLAHCASDQRPCQHSGQRDRPTDMPAVKSGCAPLHRRGVGRTNGKAAGTLGRPLDIEVGNGQRVLLNKLATRFNVVTH